MRQRQRAVVCLYELIFLDLVNEKWEEIMPKDWHATRDTKTIDQPGKSRFDMTASVHVIDPDISKTRPVSNMGPVVLEGFGVAKGREFHNAEVIKDTALETVITLLRKETGNRHFTIVWSPEGWSLFPTLKGKQLRFDIDFAQFTPGNGVAKHFKVVLHDVHVQGIAPDVRKLDKKNSSKVERVNFRFKRFEFEEI